MKINMNKDLAFAAGVGVVIGLLALSYASNNNFNKLSNTLSTVDPAIRSLAQEIIAPTAGQISDKGIANSLASKVLDAQKALNAGDTSTAIIKLNDLASEANAQKGKKISAAEANTLIDLANAAIAQIQNPVPICIGTVMSDGTCCELRVIVDEYGRELCV